MSEKSVSIVTPDVHLDEIKARLERLEFAGVSQRHLALCVNRIGVLEKVLRKMRNEVLKAMVVGASQGALPL